MLNKELNHRFMELHTPKEESFWSTYMNHEGAKDGELEARDKAFREFSSDPAWLPKIRAALGQSGLDESERVGLEGWRRFFEVHSIEDGDVRAHADAIGEIEGDLRRKRKDFEVGYQDPDSGKFVACGLSKIRLLVKNGETEALRRAAWEGGGSVEGFVLANGYLELVKERNRFARTQGFEDYYDYKVTNDEGFGKDVLFPILEDLEGRVAPVFAKLARSVRAAGGAEAARPWNIGSYVAGDVTREIEPYLQFENAALAWGRTFRALGVGYRGAQLSLDLVARKGKYENGFMHGPEPAYVEDGSFRPARINFTSNAVPGQLGGGLRALQTFFHEGGHAAHFANVEMPAVCYGQEFAPTSGGFAEIQSMFMDELLNDASWLSRYAQSPDGTSMPLDLALKTSETAYRSMALDLTILLVVPFVERAIYEIPDDELTADRVLEVARGIERRIFGGELSPRPSLSIPHFLSGESACIYHSYLLAQLGVFQTREYFLGKYGQLVDNPAVAREMRTHYWKPGNSLDMLTMVKNLTGKDLNAEAIERAVGADSEAIRAEHSARAERLGTTPLDRSPIDLQVGDLRLVHGDELIASIATHGSFEAMAEAYGEWWKGLVTEA